MRRYTETCKISRSGLLADAIFGLGKKYCLLLNITQCHFHKCSLFVMLLQHNEREGEREGEFQVLDSRQVRRHSNGGLYPKP